MYNHNFGAFWGFMGAFAFFAFLIGIIFYIAFAIGLMTMAQRRGLENVFLAFIPIAQLYLLGQIIRELKLFSYVIPSPEIVLPAASLAAIFLGWFPLIGWLIPLANFVLILGAYYTLYMIYAPENAMIYTILSPFIGPFLIFAIRNNEPAKTLY